MPHTDPTSKILTGFLDALFWASTDGDGVSLDENYDISNIDSDTHDRLYTECEDFYMSHTEICDEWVELSGRDWEYVGHDLFLTREGHGAGFWDRYNDGREAELGDLLTDAANSYGSVEPYVGDDKKIHTS